MMDSIRRASADAPSPLAVLGEAIIKRPVRKSAATLDLTERKVVELKCQNIR